MNILTIGPYERDNFGDLLFLLVIERFLIDNFGKKNINITSSSLIASDMSSVFGRKIHSYNDLLTNHKWDAVWVVGGEVGGVSVDDSFNSYLSQSGSVGYRNLHGESKADIKKSLRMPGQGFAYMPDLSKYPNNKDTPLILTSVGALDRIISARTVSKEKNLIIEQLSKSSTAIYTRSKDAHKWLDGRGISSTLTPDVVHSLPELFPEIKKPEKSDYLVFQISEDLASSYSARYVADTVSRIAKSQKLKVSLLPAGVAAGHDSVELYKEYELYMRQNGTEVNIFTERDPILITRHIVECGLWVGSSLHGRIIASSYSIPRVSLAKQKIDRYASTWDPDQPYGVTVETLEGAVIDAIKSSTNDLHSAKEILVTESMSQLNLAVAHLKSLIKTKKSKALEIEDITPVNDTLKSYDTLLSLSTETINRTKDLEAIVADQQDRIEVLAGEKDSLLNSKLWRYGSLAYRAAHKLKGLARKAINWARESRQIDETPMPFSKDGMYSNEQITNFTIDDRSNPESIIFSQQAINNSLNWQDGSSRNPNIISVVVVVYNNPRLTERCIRSVMIAVNNSKKIELVVIDNGSDNETREVLHKLAAEYTDIKIVYNDHNVNFSVGNNIAFQYTSGDRVIFLNNDTYVTDGWIDGLVSPLDNQNIMAVQPLLLYPDSSVQSMGIVFSDYSPIGYGLYTGASSPAHHLVKKRSLQAVTAACVAIRASDFIAIKGFSPDYINGQEDVDLCLKLVSKKKGRHCFVNTDVIVYHDESKSMGRGRFVESNRKTFIKKWTGSVKGDDKLIYEDDGVAVTEWVHDIDENKKRGIETYIPVFEGDITL